MGTWDDFKLAFFNPLSIFIHYKNNARIRLSLIILASAFLANALAAPVAGLITGESFLIDFSILQRFEVLIFSIISFFSASIAFKILAVIFHKDIGFKEIIATWGISFIPTLLCIILVEASEAAFYVFIGNTLLGFLLCFLLVLLLAWKAIFFFMETSVVLGLNGEQTMIAAMFTGIVYLLIIFVGFKIGIKVPML